MIEIAGRRIGPGERPFFIADIGSNHDQDLDRSCKLIPLAAGAGADAVKFQTFSAPTIVSRKGFEEVGRLSHQSTWQTGVYETYEEASLPLHWIPTLAQECRKAGVVFMSTVYSLDIADAVDPFVPAHKIGSGDISWHQLLQHVAKFEKPLMLSTGASTASEVKKAVQVIRLVNPNLPLVLLQCNTDYSGNLAARYLNLEVIRDWSQSGGPGISADVIGFSDHTPGSLAVGVALALGACVIEKHFTDDRTRPGPDHSFALEPKEWKEMVGSAELVRSMLGNANKKVEDNELEARIIQRRALRWACNLPKGHEVAPAHMFPTRPCPEGALEPYHWEEVVGKILKRDVEADTLVKLEDVE